jgi:ATP-binding cassette subfamily B protein
MSSIVAQVRASLPTWFPGSTKGQMMLFDDKEKQAKPEKPLLERIKGHGVLMMQLVPYLWPKGRWDLRARVVFSLLCLLFAKVISVATPFAYKNAVDTLSVTSAFTFPYVAIVLYSLGRFGSGFLGDLRDSVFIKVQNFALQKASIDTFAHLHGLSISYHLKRKTGSVLTGIDRGTRGIQFLTSFMLFNILPIILEVTMVSIVLVVNYSVWISLITIAVVLFYVVFTIGVTEWRTKFRRAMNEQESEAKDKAVDSLLNFETVKYFGAEQHEINRYNVALEKYSKASEKSQWSLAFLNVGQSAVIAIGQFAVMMLTAYGVGQHNMTVGDFVLINTFMLQLYTPLNFLGTSYRMIKQSLVDMEQMFDLLKESPDIRDPQDPEECNVEQGEVVFENVRFAYKDKEEVLKGINFKVSPGKQLAIVGPSGAGKSTITKLLFRFYDVTGGRILIDGIDISKVRQAELRKLIG